MPLLQIRRSIKQRLMAISLLATTSALMLVMAFMLGYEYFMIRNDLQQEMQMQAGIIQENSKAALLFGDAAAAQDVLETLHSAPNVRQAALLLPDGKLFAHYHNTQIDSASLTRLTDSGSLSSLAMELDIRVGDRKVGKLFIESRLDRFYSSLQLFAAVIVLATLAALGLSLYFMRHLKAAITDPISSLATLTNHVSSSRDYSIRSAIEREDEIGELAQGFNNMLQQIQFRDSELARELAQRQLAEDRLHQLAYYDNVTHLPNRHSFKERIELSVAAALKNQARCCLMFIDLDDFKIINDTLGHHIGDELLKEAGRRISQQVEAQDIVCRIGGDEFAVIIEDTPEPARLTAVAQNIIDTLSSVMHLDGKEVAIGASIGIALCPDHAQDVSALLRNADTAMYHAKEHGKNHHQMYRPEMEVKARKRFNLENNLRRAVGTAELQPYYQPQVDIRTGRVIGLEVLLRWLHPKEGAISPVEFIPVAEETGLILPIGEWLLRAACLHGKELVQQHPGLTLSVNLSGRQLQQSNIVDRLLAIIHATGLDPASLEIELTESMLMANTDETIEKLGRLRDAGIKISIDDFGTGYSSISYLKRFPIDALKIDRSFIQDIPADPDDIAITNAIIALGRTLGIDVIAEGVETRNQMDFLRSSGCHKAQGYLISKPLPLGGITDFLARNQKTSQPAMASAAMLN